MSITQEPSDPTCFVYLEYHCARGNLECVKKSVFWGVNVQTHYNQALITSINHSHFHIARYLMSQGAEIDGFVVASVIEKSQSEQCVRFLAEECKVPLESDTIAKPCYIVQVGNYFCLEVLQYLLRNTSLSFNFPLSVSGEDADRFLEHVRTENIDKLNEWIHKGFADLLTFCVGSFWACWNGKTQIVRWFLDNIHMNNITDSRAYVEHAIHGGHIETILFLLDREFAVQNPPDVRNLLELCIEKGQLEPVKKIMQVAEQQTTLGVVKLIVSVGLHESMKWRRGAVYIYLLDWAMDRGMRRTTFTDHYLDSALCCAAGHGCLDIVKRLVYYNVNPRSGRDNLPLRLAACHGHVPMVKYLMEEHKLFLDHSQLGWCLHNAAGNGHLEMCELLVNLGADVQAHDNWTFGYAAEKGRLKVCKFLRSKGADIHGWGDDTLKKTAKNGHADVVQYLFDEYDYPKDTLKQIFKELGPLAGMDVIRLFASKIADRQDVSLEDPDDHLLVVKGLVLNGVNVETIMNWSARYNHLRVIEYLLEIGANKFYILQVAAGYGYLDIVKLVVRSTGFQSVPRVWAMRGWYNFFFYLESLGRCPEDVERNTGYAFRLCLLISLLKGRCTPVEYPELTRDQYYDGNLGMIVCSYLD